MRSLLPILVLFTLLFAVPALATSYVQNVAVNNSAYQYWCYNITTNTLEGITSLPCTNNEDLLINFNIQKLEAWSLNESFVSIVGDVSSDCTGSISMYTADVNDLDLSNIYSLSPAPLPYQAVCLKTKEGYKAIASAFGYNGTDFNMTVQWNDEGNYYFNYTTHRDSTVYDIPIFFPALPASAYHYNAIDIDNGLNYGRQPIMTSDEIDLVDYMYANPYTVQFGATNQPNGKISAYNPVQGCYDIIYSGYAKNAQTGLAYFTDDSYCIKTSEDMLYSVQRVGYRYFTPPIHLHVTKESYPMFSTQLMSVTDTGDLWIRTGSFDADAARDNTYGFTSTPYIISPIGNKSYTFLFNAADGHVYMGGSWLQNPSGKNASAIPYHNYNTANDLAQFDCSSLEPYLPYIGITVREIPLGAKRIICYNISTANNPELFSAVKFINTTNVRGGNATEFDVYVAVYDALQIMFSNFHTIPSALSPNMNVTFAWNTRLNLSTRMRLQYRDIDTGFFTGFITIEGNANFTKVHNLTMNLTQATLYEVILDGFDANGSEYLSDVINFTISPMPLATAITGLGVCTFNEFGYPVPATVILDNQYSISTQQYLNQQQIPIQCSEFPSEIATFGNHNLSAVSYDNLRFYNDTISVQQYPYFIRATLYPDKCVPYLFYDTSEFCNQSIIALNISSIPSATGQYCMYNENECQIYNTSDGSCIQLARHLSATGSGITIGGWIHYVCFNDYNSQFYNQTVTNQTGGGGTTTEMLCTGINKLLNTTCNQSLWFVGLMLSLVIMGGLGFLTRSGLVSVSSGLVSILAFTGIGWIPIWVGIVLVVLTALLIAKFVSNSVMPQGSGD